MMQITEDTPPDMLAGAMDLTIQLPNSRTVKMSVERSTPMMDLLVQITTAHHLQHSGHILQALEMGQSCGPTDKVLPYKPNTPIGSLDTQHVKVVPKNRSNSMPKNVAVGHQPFESTFRLQVHLPRNQLYVIRVSQYVYLEDIMKKVCDEKNLDIRKYEFRHPGNLDEVLDPKLTLSDYQITEVYIVAKGTVSLTQTFSSGDIMVLKKEEERKQLQARTGGGVFSLIFKRGKQTIGSGSVSSDNRSISPSHSDDSRSVTPPAIQQQIVPVTQQPSPLIEKPKPPQRKRRPAPKPPQQTNSQNNGFDSKPSSQISTISDTNTSDLQHKSSENGLTICHSRNSSDSSGYHEPSVLSDNCNLSLPRRPKSNIINEVVNEEVQVTESSRNSGNLSSMVMFSKSTTSIASRKKKAAPPPPSPTVKSESLVETPEKASPVVASPIVETQENVEELHIDPSETNLNSAIAQSVVSVEEISTPDVVNEAKTFPNPLPRTIENKLPKPMPRKKPVVLHNHVSQAQNSKPIDMEVSSPDFRGIEATNRVVTLTYNNDASADNSPKEQLSKQNPVTLNSIVDCVNISLVPDNDEHKKAPEIIAVTRKRIRDGSLFNNKSLYQSVGSKQEIKNRTSLNDINNGNYTDNVLVNSKSASHIPNLLHDYEATANTAPIKSEFINQKMMLSQEQNVFEHTIRNSASIPSFMEIPNIKRWNNLQDLDDISVTSFTSGLGGNSVSQIQNLLEKCETTNSTSIIKSEIINELSQEQGDLEPTTRSSAHVPSLMELSNIESWNTSQDLDDISVTSFNSGLSGNSAKQVSNLEKYETTGVTTPIKSEIINQNMLSQEQDDLEHTVRSSASVPSLMEVSDIESWNTSKDLDYISVTSFNSGLGGNSANQVSNLHEKYETTDTTTPIKSEVINQNVLSQEKDDFEHTVRRSASVPHLKELSNSKWWDNQRDLDDISVTSGFGGNRWVMGGDSDTDSLSTVPTATSKQSPRESISSKESITSSQYSKPETLVSRIDSPQGQAEEPSLQRLNLIETEITASNIVTLTEAKPVSKLANIERTEMNVYEISRESKEDLSEELPELESEWQYQLPSPPTAFRDCSPTNLTNVTNYDTITIADFKDESVITNPKLFEKLELMKDHQRETDTVSDIISNVSEEEKPMLNKLTLENLEKRKSLVYNRELSTSLKIAQENDSSNSNIDRREEASSKRSDVINELEEVIQNGGKKSLSSNNSSTNDLKSTYDKHLPNFKISTYDKPKNKINIFEDDSVRSNVENSLRSIPAVDLINNKDNTPKNACLVRPLENSTYRRQSSDNSSSDDDGFRKPQEFSKYKALSKSNFYVKHRSAMSNSVIRSESFSSNNNYGNVHNWKPQNPVQRSKSQVALNNYNDEKNVCEDTNDGLSKSNSLFDVSGLQSLEVMRMIQTKLNTPTSSTEQLLEKEVNGTETKVPSLDLPEDSETKVEKVSVGNGADNSASSTNKKTYKYQGPPAINLSTWSERPKTKVSLKEDTDYRSSRNIISSHRIGPATNNNHYIADGDDSNNVSIKINGSEPIKSQESGNVVIKIGEAESVKSNTFSTRFINHTTAMGYRRPLSNINKIENTIRPHSISLDSNFDISRVPIVRSVELKKPFKETVQINNKSITQINSHNNEAANNIRNKYIDIKQNTESVNGMNDVKPNTNNTSIYVSSEPFKKPVARVSSFAQHRPSPNVIGFRGAEIGNDNTARSRKSWNVPNSYSTLPLKISPEPLSKTSTYIPNSNVPFSQMTLKRVESNKLFTDDNNINKNNDNVILRNTSVSNKAVNFNRYSTGTPYTVLNDEFIKINSTEIKREDVPPPPPTMPKITNIRKKVIKTYEPIKDPRDDLLNSIRNFGGIKGLRHEKA